MKGVGKYVKRKKRLKGQKLFVLLRGYIIDVLDKQWETLFYTS